MKDTFARIYEVTGTSTQLELAGVLGIKQSSISDANRRGRIPSRWLIILLEKYSLNPFWVRTGKGFQYMAPSAAKPA